MAGLDAADPFGIANSHQLIALGLKNALLITPCFDRCLRQPHSEYLSNGGVEHVPKPPDIFRYRDRRASLLRPLMRLG